MTNDWTSNDKAGIDDATSQLVPCCCRFKIPRSEEQNVNIYIFKSLCRHQSFQQKSPEGHSCCAVSITLLPINIMLRTLVNKI